MSTIAERQLVAAPLPSADRFLTSFMRANAVSGGSAARLVLRSGEFAEAAIVTIVRVHVSGEMTPHYAIHWESQNGGAFPVFDGKLSVESDVDYERFWLVINGEYVPPGNVAGAMFDAVLGNRIAAATTRNLLASIRDSIETAYAREEREKAALRAREETTGA